MKYNNTLLFCLLAFALVKMITKRIAENEKTPKKGGHFSNIKKVGFYDTPINTTAEESVATGMSFVCFWLNSSKPKELSEHFNKSNSYL
jgi:hypothetical protein